MSDEIPPPPFVYDGLDPVPEEKSVIGEVADLLVKAARPVIVANLLVLGAAAAGAGHHPVPPEDAAAVGHRGDVADGAAA